MCEGTVFAYDLDCKRFSAFHPEEHRNRLSGLRLEFKASPAFSFTDPDLLYGIGTGARASDHQLLEYSFRKRKYRTLLDLDKVVRHFPGGAGPMSASVAETITVVFGGGQDTFRYVVVFDKKSGTTQLLDTKSSTVNGKPAGFAMGWGMHYASIDKSGRYVVISKGNGGKKPNVVVWDTATNKFGELTPEGSGHYSAGFGAIVNGGGYGPSWAQWLLRPMDPDKLGTFTKLIVPDGPPGYGQREEHSSWANAQPDSDAPVFVSIDPRPKAEWEVWDGEIIALSTEPGERKVWRFAHHRSRYAGYFWDEARGNVSPDGRYFLFTSNWEGTLGYSHENRPREDVFLLELPLAAPAK